MVATVGNKKRDTLYNICAPRDLRERSLPNVRLQEAYNHASTKKRYTKCKRNYTVTTLIVNGETHTSFVSEQKNLRAMHRLQDRDNKVLLLTTYGRVFPSVDKWVLERFEACRFPKTYENWDTTLLLHKINNQHCVIALFMKMAASFSWNELNIPPQMPIKQSRYDFFFCVWIRQKHFNVHNTLAENVPQGGLRLPCTHYHNSFHPFIGKEIALVFENAQEWSFRECSRECWYKKTHANFYMLKSVINRYVKIREKIRDMLVHKNRIFTIQSMW